MIKKYIHLFVMTGMFSTSVLPLPVFASQCFIESERPVNQSLNVINSRALLDHLKALSSNEFSGRKFSSQGSLLAQNYITSTLTKLSIPPFKGRYQHRFTQHNLFNSKQGANIIGFIEGKKHKDQYIVLSAHYDHLGSKGSKIFNGADDNASGTSALLTFAEHLMFNPLDYSVILLFTDGEEVDLLGAKAFISEQKNLLPKIKLNINIDMIAGSKKTKMLNYINNDLDKILIKPIQQRLENCQDYPPYSLKKGFKNERRNKGLTTKTNWRMASDHAVFYQHNIPFIYFGVGTHKNYHTNKDNFGNINEAFFAFAAGSIYQRLLFIDKNIIFTDL